MRVSGGGDVMRPVFKVFSTYGHYYVYDRNRNSIIGVNRTDFDLLRRLECGDQGPDVLDLLSRLQSNGYLLENTVEDIMQPCSNCYEEYINRKTEKITLQVTQNCNLRCDYCAYTGSYNNRLYSAKTMSIDIARKGIDYLFAHACEIPRVTIGFYGGEPLLRMDLIKQCVTYVNESYPEKEVYYILTTNGTLLTDENVDYLFANNIDIMISLDGNKEMHDRHRKFPDGSGSFDLIAKNLKRIKERYPNYYKRIAINTVLSPSNDLGCIKEFYDTDDVMEFFNPQYSLVNEYNSKKPVQYEEEYFITCRTEQLKVLLWTIGKIGEDAVSSLFKDQKGYFIKNKEDLIPITGLPKICHPGGPCLAGIKRLFCDVDGNLFPCERVSEKSIAMKIGTLKNGIELDKARRLINVGEISKDACISCWSFIHCTQCAVTADDTKSLVKEQRLSHCHKTQHSVLEKFKDHCFLVEQGVDFEKLERD